MVRIRFVLFPLLCLLCRVDPALSGDPMPEGKPARSLPPGCVRSFSPASFHFPGRPHCLAVSPDESLVACCGDAGSIVVFSSRTGERLHELRSPRRLVHSVVFAKEKDTIITLTDDGIVRWWPLS